WPGGPTSDEGRQGTGEWLGVGASASEGDLVSDSRDPGESGSSGTDMRQVAIMASRIRAGIVFLLLDTVCVVAGYGVAEVAYFRHKAPVHYLEDFSMFLLVAVVVTLLSNRIFGLYGRMWRHAGADEARQLMLSAAVTLCVLVAFWPVGRTLRVQLVPLVFGCVLASAGMGVLRFHSRLFAWQRGSKRFGLRVAVIGSRDTGAAAVREMLRSPGAAWSPSPCSTTTPALTGSPCSACRSSARSGTF